MAENSLLSKLEGLQHRFDEVALLITDPDVIADMKRYVKLNKEYRDLEKVAAAKKQYEGLLKNVEYAKEMLSNETDSDLKEMARQELDDSLTKLPQQEETIKLLLTPADPEDAKNAIVEIRGGTGGDEAAIFAGDLFRMYARYCETKGWRLEVTGSWFSI